MKESMIIYESAYKAISYLPDEKSQLEALKGLLEYGFYDTVPESDNPFIKMIYVQAIPSMRNAKERYDASVENGKKGGRPAEVPTEEIIEMKQNGMTNKQIAEKLGCSEKNIEKRVSTYSKAHPTNPTNPPTNPTLTFPTNPASDAVISPTNPTNLTVSVSDTVSESVSSTDTDTGTVSSEAIASNNCPESKDEQSTTVSEPLASPTTQQSEALVQMTESERRKSKTYYFQGDWRLLTDDERKVAGRQIRDLTDDECREIQQLLDNGELYTNIERKYGMRCRTITKDFRKNRGMFLEAYANGKIPRCPK